VADRFSQIPEIEECLENESRVVSLRDEDSLAAEKFRFLAVRLRYIQQRRPLKKLLVTSTVSEEGKSFVSLNLAITLARKQRQKVLLIEGDLRRPGITPQLGLQHLPGLCESLAIENDGLSNIVHLQNPRIWLMPAGTPPENPLELMQSRRLPDFISQMEAWFDWIVIDSPPILPLADTTVWSRIVDGVLLVVREGKTEKATLKRSLENLGKSDVVGVVLNSCSDVDQTNYYQRYGVPATQRNGS
jgi:capsular exopolysaccharide synthesis family protein